MSLDVIWRNQKHTHPRKDIANVPHQSNRTQAENIGHQIEYPGPFWGEVSGHWRIITYHWKLQVLLFPNINIVYLLCTRHIICIEGILPKGPYLPCVSMADRALLVGYHRYIYIYCGLYSLKRQRLIGIGIPFMNLIHEGDWQYLRLMMGIPIPVRQRLFGEYRPSVWASWRLKTPWTWLFFNSLFKLTTRKTSVELRIPLTKTSNAESVSIP